MWPRARSLRSACVRIQSTNQQKGFCSRSNNASSFTTEPTMEDFGPERGTVRRLFSTSSWAQTRSAFRQSSGLAEAKLNSSKRVNWQWDATRRNKRMTVIVSALQSPTRGTDWRLPKRYDMRLWAYVPIKQHQQNILLSYLNYNYPTAVVDCALVVCIG